MANKTNHGAEIPVTAPTPSGGAAAPNPWPDAKCSRCGELMTKAGAESTMPCYLCPRCDSPGVLTADERAQFAAANRVYATPVVMVPKAEYAALLAARRGEHALRDAVNAVLYDTRLELPTDIKRTLSAALAATPESR